MSIRRPRIKAIANVGVKRKIKEEPIETNNKSICEASSKQKKDEKPLNDVKQENMAAANEVCENYNTTLQTTFVKSPIKKQEPLTLEISHNVQTYEQSQIQFQKSHEIAKTAVVTEPVKTRQRIKATPVFETLRRNSTSTQSDVEQQLTPTPDSTESPFKDPLPKPKLSSTNINKDSSRATFGFVPSTNTSIGQKNSQLLPPPSPSPKDVPIQQQQQQHQQQQREIPQRTRKISNMEDINKLAIARKDFQTKYSGKLPEKSLLKMFDFIYYNPSSNPMKFENLNKSKELFISDDVAGKLSRNSSRASTPAPLPAKEDVATADEPQAVPVPQLKLGPNGELMLDEKSLVIETTAAQNARQQLASKDCIFLDEYSGNNGFYSRQKRTKDWRREETIKFYRCLHTVGTDFSLMLTLFPNRTRRDLKLKFKKEERLNGHLINKAILQPKTFNIDELKEEFKKEEEDQEEKERQWKKLAKQHYNEKRQRVRQQNNKYKSKADRVMQNGELAYENENKSSKSTKSVAKRSKKRTVSENIEEIINKTLDKTITVKKEKSVDSNNQDEVCESILKEIISDENDEIENNSQDDFKPNISPVESDDDNDDDDENGDGIIEITDIGEIFSISDIMPQLADTGSLALVTRENPIGSNNLKHEIYILCKSSKTLSKKPLDLPEDTIKCILTAIGKYGDNEI